MGYIEHKKLIHSEAKNMDAGNIFMGVMIAVYFISWVAVYLHDLGAFNALPR